jgi:hypothetical protein
MRAVVGLTLAVLTLVLAGCGSLLPGPAQIVGDPVQIVTGCPRIAPCSPSGEVTGCYANPVGINGDLVADPQYGTVMENAGFTIHGKTQSVVIAWPPGYTGRRDGSEVSVLDRGGSVVATTGHRYHLDGGYATGLVDSETALVFWTCYGPRTPR